MRIPKISSQRKLNIQYEIRMNHSMKRRKDENIFSEKEWDIWEIQKSCWNINECLNYHLQERICQISMTIESLSINNFISPRPTFWKILTLIDFLEQVIATLNLSTWWKHSVKNSQCKNEVLLNELLGKWKEWILKKNKPQLHH